jgi:hypothetical protein
MKKVLTILIPFTLLVFLFSSALAIDRVPRKEDSTSGEKKEEMKSSSPAKTEEEITPSGKEEPKKESGEQVEPKKTKKESGLSKILKKLKPSRKEEIKEKYDYFIDKNKNGIDDRLEKKKAEKEETEEAEKIEKTKAPTQTKSRGKRR